jgi:shikimate kinase
VAISQPTPAARNVVLTGFMGTGKTTVGRLLATTLDAEFVDTDDIIVERHGPIAEIFSDQGEGAFRSMERDVAAELGAQTGLVISTGGRMMLDATCVEMLESTGRVFCLAADPQEILRRVMGDGEGPARPLLAGPDPAERVLSLLRERAEGYGRFEQIATDDRPPADVCEDIASRL